MIVPFSKQSAQAAQGPSLGDLPPAVVLMAMGQARADGKFHVYDPRIAQKQFDDTQTDRDQAKQRLEGKLNAKDLKTLEKEMEDAQKDTTDKSVEEMDELENRPTLKSKQEDI